MTVDAAIATPRHQAEVRLTPFRVLRTSAGCTSLLRARVPRGERRPRAREARPKATERAAVEELQPQIISCNAPRDDPRSNAPG